MWFPLFVAKRYFIAKEKKNFISIISIIAMVGASLGTAALVIVLSIFNGLEDLLRSLYNSFDPEIKISMQVGKSFYVDDNFFVKLKKVDGVAVITEVIEDNALVRYGESRTIVRIKGVSENYVKQSNIARTIKEGSTRLQENGINYAVMGSSLQRILSAGLDNDFYTLQVWYPKKQAGSSINPESAFNKGILKAGGVFAIEQEYDERYLLAPLLFVEGLMDYRSRRTSIEIKTRQGYSIEAVKIQLQRQLGDKFRIEDRDQQHASLYKAIKIEKIFGFITFSFILLVASLSIFFSLTMLGIEKKKDIAVLFSMGASPVKIRNIFLIVGALIAMIGSAIGLIIGFIVCWIQKEFGIVSMGLETSIVQGYPVKIIPTDFFLTGITIIFITVLLSYGPAITASRLNVKANL